MPPTGWASVAPQTLEAAFAAAWDALDPSLAAARLRDYYRADGNYAGATFVEAVPTDADQVTATDLFAITLLSVNAPKPHTTRQILDPGPIQSLILELLTSPRLGNNLDLATADSETLLSMALFYDLVKRTLGSNPWVTAGKLCARKRPRLFPVRDRLVCGLLGLSRHSNYEVDWQVYRALIGDHQLIAALQAARDEAATTPGVHIDMFPLRWLDVVLWMHAKSEAR